MQYNIILVLALIICGASAQQFTTTGCGTTKACFQSPSGCKPSDASCFFVSWAYNSSTTMTVFELSVSQQPSSNAYIAVGFTETSGMANADTYICTSTQFVSSVISGQSEPTDVASLPSGVALISQTTANGKIQCSFSRPLSVTKTVSGTSTVFDFSSKQFYLLVATGAADSAGSSVTTYHSAARQLSASKFDFTTGFGGGGAAGVSGLIKAHGALMILAWLFLAHSGVIIARNFKKTWPGKQVGGKDIWFQIHRTMMVLAVLATIIGFICIFVDAQGFIETQNNNGALSHIVIGFIVTVLALLNPIIAFFRPHPGTPNRKYFFFFHSFIGGSARGLGIANLFIGVGLSAMALERWPIWVLTAFVIVMFLVEVFLGIMSYCAGKNCKNSDAQPENIDMANNAQQNAKTTEPEKYGGLKQATLAFYLLFALGCTVAIWIPIAQT